MRRSFGDLDLVAIYVAGIVVVSHHIIAAVGVDAQGNKHALGLASGSSENAKVVRDLDVLVDAPSGITLLGMPRIRQTIEAEPGLSVNLLAVAALPPVFRDQVPAVLPPTGAADAPFGLLATHRHGWQNPQVLLTTAQATESA